MSHNENTSRNVINILSDFRNISTFAFGSCPSSYDSVVRMLIFQSFKNVISCGC